ncbi:MAG: ECF transporter S component [Ardenticatenaceae bacterium]|nr:ECF transporter S component [Anaerolineales bacterium]MCB8919952.1 ECF transporter S component [Ardenticatenaceae bacterium]MCB8989799.1 ECF transporter S component [Ardenticatenaceae bacterium]MCB9003975.1 ECF transporter S component [Ardenticatenaceae bacterium]
MLQTTTQRTLSTLLYLVAGLTGLLAFAAPFLTPHLLNLVQQTGATSPTPYRPDAPLVTSLLLLLSLAVLLVEVQGQAVSAKIVAALGVLVAVTAVLRFIEVAIPGPGGLSPIFAPIILAGFVFGARFGFLMGTMTLLVSALITGGVGPWLPYQMFAAGWVGLTAGWLPKPRSPKVQITLLASFGFLWGLLFGAILNLYFWPFLNDGSLQSWQPGLSLAATLGRYASFYAATSLLWDIGRGLGNAVLILALGYPAIQVLVRFRDRFQFRRN